MFSFFNHTELSHVALTYEESQITYAELFSYALQRSEQLDKNGHQAYLLDHKHPILFCIDFLACAYIGVPVVVGNFTSSAESIEYQKLSAFTLEDFKPVDNLNAIPPKFSERFKFGILSSGSSGAPKVIWRKIEQWLSAFEHQSQVFNIPSQNTLFVIDALVYSANFNAVLHTLWSKGTVVFGNLKDFRKWKSQIVDNGVDSIFLVPSHWNLVVGDPIFTKVQSCVSAGEKLAANLAREIAHTFQNATITEYYGAAELGHISYQHLEEILENPLSVGKPFPQVEVLVTNNIIEVKSPYVASDYKKHGTVNDLGYWKDGNLILLGREGRMFNKRGLNIYAQEIETVVTSHSQVQAAYLTSNQAQKLVLNYELAPSARLSQKEVWEFLESKLPTSKQPHFIKEVEELPKLDNGKIDMKEAKRLYDGSMV